MCYIIALSTDSNENLSELNDEALQFSSNLPLALEKFPLSFENKWFVTSNGTCGCGFRHLHSSSVELGFSEPVDWYPEESSEIEATKKFIAVARKLIKNGNKVDCVDLWDHQDAPPSDGKVVEIDLSEISDEQFRFFEDHCFSFSGGT
ncbi:MAG: hypothetical protein GKR91_14545 [Pseudomonadales bacterium]|nr:hypothetical protein [Pseudomonadales bacterium]